MVAKYKAPIPPFGNAPSSPLAASSTVTPITTAATVPAAQGASAGASSKRNSQGRGLSSEEGIVVTGKFRRAPDPSCSYFTVANIHTHSECAGRRTVCIALLLLVRDLCLKLGEVILPSDFNKGAQRDAAASGSMDQRRESLHLRPPSATPTSHGLLPVPTRCGALAVSLKVARGPNAACSFSFPSHRNSGFSCAMVP